MSSHRLTAPFRLRNLYGVKLYLDTVKNEVHPRPIEIEPEDVTMDAGTMFQFANMGVLAGWAALLASPWMPRLADLVAAWIVPGLISVAYAGLILAFWSGASGGFDSLEAVSALFQTPELLLAGWLHYLAFDLFVGAWIVREGRREKIAFPLVAACLPFTFLFGPAGFLLFVALRGARRLTGRTVTA
jgi:hypothetical protein